MTTESKRMRPSPSSRDIISNLPSDAMDNILTRIPLRDAVRTSVLSRSWRYKWTTIPYLVFGDDMLRETTWVITHNRLVIALYDVAIQYLGTAAGFDLSVPQLRSCPQIDRVISLVSKDRGFKEFTLHILDGDEPYKLPSSVYSWVDISRLSLEFCVIEPPIWFKGFNRLVSLEISDCSVHHDVLLGLISGSPILEKLKVVSPFPMERSIEIWAPNLKELFFIGVFPYIFFKYAPRLHRCDLKLHVDSEPDQGKFSNIFQSLHNLSAINHLELSYYYSRDKSDCGNVPKKLTTTLNHLTYLRLVEVCFGLLHEVSNFLCLIRSSPNLVKIVVVASPLMAKSNDGLEDVMRLFQVQEWSEVNLNHLQEVEFHKISGTPSELGFIELLLTILPKLETLIITTDHNNVRSRDRFEITTKVMGYRRVSPLAKIIYKNDY